METDLAGLAVSATALWGEAALRVRPSLYDKLFESYPCGIGGGMA